MENINYTEFETHLEIEAKYMGTSSFVTTTRYLFIILVLPIIVMIPFFNPPGYLSNVFIIGIEQIINLIIIIIGGLLLYFLILNILFKFHQTDVQNRPHFFKIKFMQFLDTYLMFFGVILVLLIIPLANIPISVSSTISAIYFTSLFFLQYSLIRASKNSFYKTIINRNASAIQTSEYVPFLGKTIYTVHTYRPNSAGLYHIGVSYLSGIGIFEGYLPRLNRHLSANELSNFQKNDNLKATVRRFTVILMDGDIIEDDVQLNDLRYKGKPIGSPIGYIDQSEKVYLILQMINDYIPIKIIKPIQQSQSFGGF